MSNTTYKDKCLLPDCLGRATAESPSLDLPRRCQCIHNARIRPADNKCATGRISAEAGGGGRIYMYEGTGVITYQCCLLFETLLTIMGLNFQEDLKSQNHILDTFMHIIKNLSHDRFQCAS